MGFDQSERTQIAICIINVIKYNFITVGREKVKTELINCVLEKNILVKCSLLRCCRKENIMYVFTVDSELCNLHPVCVYCNSLILRALNGKLTDKVRLNYSLFSLGENGDQLQSLWAFENIMHLNSG